MEKSENRHFILQISLKCADISNPCRPWDISRKWSYKVCEEFFRQGDYERKLNLPVTPLCDRQSISIPKIQAGFFEFVVTPLYEEWHRFLGEGLSVSLMRHLRGNQKKWESLIVQETAEETKTEMSDLEEIPNSSTSDEDEHMAAADDSEGGDFMPPEITSERRPSLPAPLDTRKVNRRHSVPLSVTRPLSLLPRTSESRRESMPSHDTKPAKKTIFRLDEKAGEESLRKLSSLSLFSSKSSIYESAENASSSERPVSAENLLPETSIASITSSVEASRLSTVLQSDNIKSSQSKHLTRQQTFPPLQPYVRVRYMSTTAEMAKCRTEILMEADDSPSSSDPSSTIDKSAGCEQCCSTCSETDCHSSRHTKSEGPMRISREHATSDHRGSRHRESAFSDLTRHSLDVCPLSADLPRRHSVQAMRNEDPNLLGLRHRHRRPSSAQEAYPTQVIYASLIGATKIQGKSNGSEIPGSDSRPDSRTDTEQPSSTVEESETTKSLVQRVDSSSSNITGTFEKCSALSEVAEITKDSELRRYSTPMTTVTPPSGENGGRRFTVPANSELMANKVFFIGTPPASPPRLPSVSSSSDSGSEPRRSIGESSSEGISLGSKRDSDGYRQKNSKIPKLSDDGRMKENVDPRTFDDSNKSLLSTRRTTQVFTIE